MQSLGGSPTRLDLQTTVQLGSSLTQFGARCLWRARTTRRSRRGRPPTTGLTKRSDGLCIGTVGLRTGRSFARVYDKGIEAWCAPQGTLWRIELEAKRDLARNLWTGLTETQNAAAYCFGILERSFRSWDLRWPLPSSSQKYVMPPCPKRIPPDAEAHARWIRRNVAPVIPRLLGTFGTAEVLAMLGMDGVAVPTESEDTDA